MRSKEAMAASIRPLREVRRQGQDFFDFFLFKAAVLGKEFQAVSIVRQMAGRNHDRPVHGRVFKNDRHEHGRRRCQTAVGDVNAPAEETGKDGFFHLIG